MKMPIPDVVAEFIDSAREYAEGKQMIIAENSDFGIEITLEGTLQYGSLYAELTVWGDQNVYESKTCYSEQDFRETLEGFYESYLINPNVIDTLGFLNEAESDDLPSAFADEEDDGFIDDEEDAMLREEELDKAVLSFVTAVYGCDPIADSPDYDRTFGELKESLISVLSEFDADIYRPGVGSSYPYVNT